MKILVSSVFKQKYKKIIKKNSQLSKILDKKFVFFNKNPNHPSLRLHKLSGKKIDQWSISVKKDLRIIFQYIPGGILIVDIGSHNEVY